jgi:Domain of unknown function (DUF4386)
MSTRSATTPSTHELDADAAPAAGPTRRSGARWRGLVATRRRPRATGRPSGSSRTGPSRTGPSASARLTEMPARKLATITGLLWIATFITSIPAVLLYDPLLNDPNFILGAGGGDTRIYIGATLELLLIIANIGTAVVPFALLRRYNERLAVGYVAARLVECGFIAVGIVSVLAIMTLRQDPGSASDDTLLALGQSLVAIHDATFLLGPGFVVGVGNGLILGYLMYTSGLMPRRLALFGLVGGPLVCLSGIAVMFGAFDAGPGPQGIATIPEIIWEASIGIYLTFKGFKATSPAFGESRDAAVDPRLSVAVS